jgi:hypothetical protein
LKRTLGFVVLAALAGVPAGAQSTSGMAAMQYYVGSWSCVAANVGQKPVKATATFAMDSGVLREWVVVPAQGKMTKPYALALSISYDAKNKRYVQATLDNLAGWTISYAAPWAGNTEQWTDHASDSGKLGHSQTVRTNQGSFSLEGYASMTAAKPNFKGSCTRAS